MHVAVFADIEGSFGIWRMRQCRMGTPEWQYGRSCLTEDVNHAVQGAFEGGARTVTVKDIHEMGFNCLIDRLDRRARYVGGHYIRPTFFGAVREYALILYVAIHAASGTEKAFFPHTHYGIFSDVRINGRRACEMDIYGAYLGEFGVPIGLVSGEEVALEQALQALPWAIPVAVDKRHEAYNAGEASRSYLREGRAKLREKAAEAVKRASEMKPLVLSGPLHFEAVFRSRKLADRYNTWKFEQDAETVSWDADTMIEGFEKLNKLTFFPKYMYPVRRPIMFLTRLYCRTKNTYFPPKPDPEDAVVIS